jgi:hypothetical protein
VDGPGEAVPWLLRAPVRWWLWSREADAEAVPRPIDSPDQRLPGPDPLNVLVVGAGAAAGWGVLSHSLGFTGALARRLRGATQRGVVVRGRVGLEVTIDTAPEMIRETRTRFDEVRVVVLGITETFRMIPPATWRRGIEHVLEALEPAAGRPAVLTGIQPISCIPVYAGGMARTLDRHAAALNRETAAACAAVPHTAFAPLSAPPRVAIERYRGPADYDFWADHVVPSIVSVLPPPGAHPSPSSPHDAEVEERRQAELARLGIRGARASFAVDDIVRFARSVFRMSGAELMILDGDRAWGLSADGTEPHDIERETSFTSYAIESRGPFVVEDALADPRFRDFPQVVGEPHVRFVAGYPVEGPSGERIGVLCVYDAAPRTFDEPARELLRALAERIEQALSR